VIAHVAAARPVSAFDLKELRKARVSQVRTTSLGDAEDIACTCPPKDKVLAQFAEEGVAGRMYEGFEQRDEQLEMAGAVVDAFATRTHVAIEAGTGVGKSVAYLVPSALFALENGVGVGVATKTNSLMDQLVHGELPALNEALGGGLNYVSLKGYDHYPCLRKLQRFSEELDDTADEDRISTLAAVLAWVAQSSWGDLDSVNVHWSREVRGGIGASQADCTRKRCRFHPNLCYLHGVRRRAASAHIVVTNHALLFRDVVAQGGILPPLRYWVIDEAHSAENEARKQLTVGASHVELSVVLGALHGKGRGGLLDTLARDLAREPDGASAAEVVLRMRDQTSRCATLSDSLFDFVKDLGSVVGETGYDASEVRVTDEIRDSGPWGTVASTGTSLARRLEPLIAEGRELMTRLEELGPDYSEPRADLAGLLSRLADQHIGLVTVLDGEADEFVYSVSFDRRRTVTPEKLRASRLDVGEVLAEEFFPRSHSVLMTSATIATGDSFEHFARSVGLDRLPPECWRSLRLSSSYDFDRQMSVFVPADIAEPGSRSYLADLEALLEGVHRAMGGSVLTLFTNRRDMEALYEALEPRLEAHGISLLVQGRGTSAKRLRDEFLADERLSLFATKSFWEGFDAKGDTLRCVVVPKLPFGQLKDPLYEERQARDPRAWQHYYLPEAVLELKQAAGRLIRSSTDTGCLVIADSRVAGGRKRYAHDFLSALPVSDVEILPSGKVVEEIERRFGRVQA
jgi:ATP-dependent DNA helicase DinG